MVYYGQPYLLEDAERVLIQGTFLEDGSCQIGNERAIDPNRETAEIEVAYDPATCRSLMETGTWIDDDSRVGIDPSSPAQRETEKDGESASFVGGSTEATSGSFTASNFPQHQAYSWTWFDEPARWLLFCDVEDTAEDGCLLPPVNTVRNDITWTADGNCAVAPGTTANVSFAHTMLMNTGWTRPSHTWNRSSAPFDCSQPIMSESFAHFNNQTFCGPFLPTDTYHEPNGVYGFKDGTATYSWQMNRNTGICSSLLRVAHKDSFI